MADIEFIVPGSGIVQDTEEGFEMIAPGFGIYQEQEAASGTSPSPRTNIQGCLMGPMGGPV